MQNLFAKLAALGILLGGFALTGDLGRLAERGSRVIGAADVASAPAMAFGDAPPAVPELAPPAPTPAERAPAAPEIQVDPPVAPIGGTSTAAATTPAADSAGGVSVAGFTPPAGGPESVSIADLRPGDRVVVWLGLGSARHRCLVLDVVDPSAGAALVYEAAAVNPLGQPLTAAGPPRRVVVSGPRPAAESRPGAIVRGQPLLLVEAGLAAAGRGGAWSGPVESLAVVH
jgi:hypothetical protein